MFLLALAFAYPVGANEPPILDLVDVRSVDRSIVVELRYAGKKNFTGRALYPRGTKALVRPEMAKQLADAQRFLRGYSRKLKIWDAYRSPAAQAALWEAAPNGQYVAHPSEHGGSIHAWGVAVDATLVDYRGRELKMPTDFDDFTPAAMLDYTGGDPIVRSNLELLQAAMARNGFHGMRTEWWHFTMKEWRKYLPPKEARSVAPEIEPMDTAVEEKLPSPQ